MAKAGPLLILLSLASLVGGCATSSDPTSSDQTSSGTTSSGAPSSGTVRFGQQTRTSGCRPRGTLPDAGCTPGSIITQATTARICMAGYSRRVRNVPASLKAAVYAEYGIAGHAAGRYEVDHLVPLELGGSNSIANLWPEIAPGYGQKDSVENELHAAVCAGSVTLRAAQTRIARDWHRTGVGVPTAAYRASALGAEVPGAEWR